MSTENRHQGPDQFVKKYYDAYVLGLSEKNTVRTQQRVNAVLGMLGGVRGDLLCIGAGNLVEPLMYQSAGFSVTIVDVASPLLEQARQNNLAVVAANIEHDPLPQGYAVVSCLEVLEHTVDPLGSLRNVMNCTESGENLFVSTPNEFHIARRLQILLGKPDFSRYDWPHLRFFNQHSARELFAAAGLKEDGVAHMPLIPPRMKSLQAVARLLARFSPGLFAISHVFRLSRGS